MSAAAAAPWHLHARPEALVRAALAWRDVARCAGEVELRVERAARSLLHEWRGEAAAAYQAHQRRLCATLREIVTTADEVGALLGDGAAVLRQAQSQLADARAGGADEGSAWRLRADAQGQLDRLAAGLARAGRRLADQTEVDNPSLSRPRWLSQLDPARPGAVIVDGDRAVVTATGGDDGIRVDVDPSTGEQLVRIAGVTTRVPARLHLVVRAGAGNDTITVAPGCTVAPECQVRVTLLGGTGADTMIGSGGTETMFGLWGRDTLRGRGGADLLYGGTDGDYLEGGTGDDLLDGGTGADTLYGLAGRDRLRGGGGRDYLDGGLDGDRLAGGGDADVVHGGQGDDVLRGGAGADVLYPGAGTDLVTGGGGYDTAYAEAADAVRDTDRRVTVELVDVSGSIRIEGTGDFVSRVCSDLQALRASPRGAQLLAALAAAQRDHAGAGLPVVGELLRGDTLVIRETSANNGYTVAPRLSLGPTAAEVWYNPSFDDLRQGAPTPPVVVLYHELAHVYDAYYGTAASGTYTGADNSGVPNLEREATGLPIDADGDPTTPDQLYPDHPYALTENGLREELGLPQRPAY